MTIDSSHQGLSFFVRWLENTHCTERDCILSDEDDLDLCEGCGEWKRVVIVRRKHKLLYDLATIIHIIRKDPDVKQRL